MRRIVLILVVAVLSGSCSGARDSATIPPPATTQAAATGEIDGSFDVGGHSSTCAVKAPDPQGHRPSWTCMDWAATALTSSRSMPS